MTDRMDLDTIREYAGDEVVEDLLLEQVGDLELENAALRDRLDAAKKTHGGLSCDAAEEDRYGLAAGYAELPGLRQQIAALQTLLISFSRNEEGQCWCASYDPPFGGGHRYQCDEARELLHIPEPAS